MGVDTGKHLHVVISRFTNTPEKKREIIYLGMCACYTDLDGLMERFNVGRCVIDALPEIHATRAFAKRHRGKVWLNYFVESQRGSYSWDRDEQIVRENRTEALDASRQAIRDQRVVLPQASQTVRTFAEHLTCDVKQLVENQDTGQQSYRYLRTGTDHYSLAFTYDCIAWSKEPKHAARSVVGIVRRKESWAHGFKGRRWPFDGRF